MSVQFIELDSDALNIKVSIFAVDDQILLTCQQMNSESYDSIYRLARERAISMDEALLTYRIDDTILVDQSGEPKFSCLFDMDFDEQKILLIAKEHGFEPLHFVKDGDHPGTVEQVDLSHPELIESALVFDPYYIAFVLWTEDDVIEALEADGFDADEFAVKAVRESLQHLIPFEILRQDSLKTAICRVSHQLQPLSDMTEAPFQPDLWSQLAA
jgi:hypothetical protein